MLVILVEVVVILFQAIEDKELIREQCEQLGDHYIAIQVRAFFRYLAIIANY